MPDLWPYDPQRVTEALEWLTDIQRTRTTEKRDALRYIPRQFVTLTSRFNPALYGSAKSTMRANTDGQWYVPLWFAQSRVTLAPTDTVIPVEWEDSYGDRAVIWQSNGSAKTVVVSSVGGGNITLSVGCGVTGVALVMPCVSGWMQSPPRTDRITPYDHTVQVTFVVDAPSLTAASAYSQLDGGDIVTDRRCMVGQISGSLARANVDSRSLSGQFSQAPLRDAWETDSMMWLANRSTAETIAARQWLASIRGRQKFFWVPEYGMDLTLTTSAGTDTLTTSPSGSQAGFEGRSLYIEKTDGSSVIRAITGITGTSTWTVQLDDAIGFTLAPSEVAVLCVVTKFHSAADRFEIDHMTGGQSRIAVPLTEAS